MRLKTQKLLILKKELFLIQKGFELIELLKRAQDDDLQAGSKAHVLVVVLLIGRLSSITRSLTVKQCVSREA